MRAGSCGACFCAHHGSDGSSVNVLVYVCMHPILWFLRVPQEVMEGMRQYLVIIYAGLLASSLYNFFACLLRALGNSTVPLVFLAVSSVLNIGLDLLFVVGFHWGIRGAAAATVVSQYIAGIGILLYVVVSQSGRAAGETMKPQKSQQKGMLREGFDPVIMKENYNVVFTDLSAAVGHEFWNSDGAGACKQFRGNNDGGICGSGQN